MKRLSYDDFRAAREDFRRSVESTPDVSPLCSGPEWQEAAHESLHGLDVRGDHLIVRDGNEWLVFVEREQPRLYFPFESSWMFGCPFVGDPGRCFALLRAAAGEWLERPVAFCIGGVRVGGALHGRLGEWSEQCRRVQAFPATDCMAIDLSDGVDAWWARRSRKFRRSLQRQELPEDVAVVDASREPVEESFARVLRIQQQSYKWREGADIFQVEPYRRFYRDLFERLGRIGGLRLLFVRRGGEDVAYIAGGVTAGTYRGFQMSYVESVREAGVGNGLQLENLRRCAEEGVGWYDLGMHAPYKERWADYRQAQVGVFVVL